MEQAYFSSPVLSFIVRGVFAFALSAFNIKTTNAQLPVAIPSMTGINELAQQKPDSALLYWQEKMSGYRLKKDLAGEANCLQQMGRLLYHLGNYSTAIEKLLAADKIYRSAQANIGKDAMAENINLLGTVYYSSQQPAKAMAQFREALAIFSTNYHYPGMATTYAAIGHMYEKQQRYDSAFHFAQVAMKYATLSGEVSIQASVNENIGSIYEDIGQYDSARYFFNVSLSQYEQTNNLLGRIEVINNLGDIYQEQGNYQQGLRYARQAMTMAAASKSMYQLQSAFRDMGQNFALLKQFDSAYLYLDKSRTLVQQLYTTESSHQIALQETLFDTEKKNLEIDRLQADKKKNILLNVAAGILLLLLSLLGAVVISRQRLKIKVERAINERNQEVFKTQKGLMESEMQRQQLMEENLQRALQSKSTELSSHILHLIQKNEVLESISTGLSEIIKDEKRDQKKQVKQLLQKINTSFSQDVYWEQFRLIFDQVHPSFFSNLSQHCPALTASEVRLLSLIKMNVSTADISTLLAITPDSLRVNRYRVKKKLNLEQGESLTAFIQTI